MCGIAGVFSVNSSRPAERTLGPIAHQRLGWRGPDAAATWENDEVLLAHTRLSVIDVSDEANQPLSYEGVTLVFNGEIYNYRALASANRLDERAHRSDSWLLLEMLAHRAPSTVVDDLYGMYAFAAYYHAKSELHLCRDAFGIKPLYWTMHEGCVAFASDPLALVEWRRQVGAPVTFARQAIAHYLLLGYMNRCDPAWEEIFAVDPGQTVVISRGGIEAISSHVWASEHALVEAEHDLLYEVEDALEHSISRHLVADVPVGIFLSGGIDSGLITAFASRRNPLKTYSVGFSGAGVQDESPMARGTAELFGCEHTSIRLGGSDFPKLAEEVGEAYPQPFGDAAAMPTLALSRRAREDVKVVLSGEGGDEMFGGYRRLWALPLARSIPLVGVSRLSRLTGNRRVAQVVLATRGGDGSGYVQMISPVPLNDIRAMAPGLDREFDVALSKFDTVFSDETMHRSQSMAGHELRHHLPDAYLEKTDRATMRHGLEARVPFLDMEVLRVARRLPPRLFIRRGETKVALRHVARRNLGHAQAYAPKQGFGVPVATWMHYGKNFDWVRDLVRHGALVESGLVEAHPLAALVRRCEQDHKSEAHGFLYLLLAFELWTQYQDRTGLRAGYR